ncbi:hypothetical protein MBM_06278 [Drepanopeziza brunnea f. sp. 'multigermtubi' MB_m1]|uniref:Secreted protein n=1 Tax=Marssonina brunnea f. sp. multigermtubi (strain MB_m1) TaxID=1072389 RepID=K1WE51_MARBU|nr:uncharacterized protein MBM_06278 [Drepanopeziza brunnea f. sp. 'multigermtubi' MB_m1]EKD15650.1 hypothetical protein MBM_06278 [Drepanopeziza brunnea f. sp. 'multigermtubi' MB_m1]
MQLSATTLLLALTTLVAASPRHSAPESNVALVENHPNSIEIHINGAKVGIDVGSSVPSGKVGTKSEQIPGWMFFDGKRLQARIHGNTFWNIKGEHEDTRANTLPSTTPPVAQALPMDEVLLDPIIFCLNHPSDFDGPFTGRIGRGEILMTWEKSGATIRGRSGLGDFEIKGTTEVDWSP